MNQYIILSILFIYFISLYIISLYTSKKANNETFFIGNRNSNWLLVAFGMIGTSLSGVTFVSVPGTVGFSHFEYFQVVIGYFIGYIIIAFVLLPLYYKMNLTSIYGYLEHRFGMNSYKTGATFFIISRVLGATARLYLVINILQIFVFDFIKIPLGSATIHINFWLTTFIILLMILLYTFRGGVKTIVFTDTLQTVFMLLALIICIVWILSTLNLSFSDAFVKLNENGYTQIFNTNFLSSSFFLKQILGGMFITITMTGLDQEMMQKNISVKKLTDSQKNMFTFSTIMVFVNFIFLLLGGLLYVFAQSQNIDIKGDDLFPTIALQYMPFAVSIIFIIGLISALFPSADGAITALTSSFCVDILGINRNKKITEDKRISIRKSVHIAFIIIFFLCVMIFKWLDDKSIITIILTVAAYTYGPLLGLFAFGIFTKRILNEKLVLVVCLIAPILTHFISILPFALKTNYFSVLIPKATDENFTELPTLVQQTIQNANFYSFGFELLIVNGLITFLGLFTISHNKR